MPRTVRAVATIAALFIGAAGQRAYGHAPPEGRQLAWSEGDGSPEALPTVVTNRGVVFPDGTTIGASFSVLCSEAYAAQSVSVVHALYDRRGALVITTETQPNMMIGVGVRATPDRGCSWVEGSGLPSLPLGGFAQAPDAPDKLWLTTQSYQQQSQIMFSADAGRSWSVRATNGPVTVYAKLLAGPAGRLYASGDRFDDALKKLVPVFASSRDEGATWSETTPAGAYAAVGVHPRNADVLFARQPLQVRPGEFPRDSLLRSSDGGQTFTPVLELRALTAFAASSDGASVWVGGEDGLYRSRDEGKTFEQVQPDHIHSVTCLHYRQDRLWSCANTGVNVNGVWLSADGGDTWREILTFEVLRTKANQRVICQTPTEQTCEEPWQDYSLELLGGSTIRDGGNPMPSDAGADSTSTGASAPDAMWEAGVMQARDAQSSDAAPVGMRSAGCSLQRRDPSGSAGLAPLAGMLTALALRLQRRRWPAREKGRASVAREKNG